MRLPVALLLLVSSGSGCASPLSHARASFAEGRYPEALSEYRALRPALDRLPRSELFQYALYRGLSHLAMGDAQPAIDWLRQAKGLLDGAPELGSAGERGQLLAAWRSMGFMPGDG